MAVKAKGRVTFVKNIPGDAAISVDMTPRQVVLNTNNSGVVEDFSGAVATVTAYRGSEPISPTNITIRRVQNCVARVDMTTRTVKITQVSQNGDTGYSHEYGSVDIDVRVGTQTFTQKLTFIVNIHKVVARMKQEQDRVLLSVTELKKSEGAMKEVISSISTNVEEIQLEVASREYGGTNLLYGTSFNELPPPLTSFRLDSAVNNATLGMDDSKKHLGRNYLRIEQRGATEAKFSGLFHCVAVEPGGIYTASVWIMSDDIASIDNKGFAIEVVKMKGGERVSGNAVLGYQYTKPKIANQWERLKFTFTVPDDINQIGVNFWLSQNGRICISEPQLERGNVLTDWSENPNDVKNSLESAGIKITKDSIKMKARNVSIEDDDGESKTLFEGGKLKAEYIDLQRLLVGIIDANNAIINNIRILSGAVFGGYIQTSFKDVNSSDATMTAVSEGKEYLLQKDLNVFASASIISNTTIVLPVGSDRIGQRIMIYAYPRVTRAGADVVVRSADNKGILGYPHLTQTDLGRFEHPRRVNFSGGIIELVAVPSVSSSNGCTWCITSLSYETLEYSL